jgi:hypothetical protein
VITQQLKSFQQYVLHKTGCKVPLVTLADVLQVAKDSPRDKPPTDDDLPDEPDSIDEDLWRQCQLVASGHSTVLDGKYVRFVNSHEIKLTSYMDFIEGGNGLRYDYIPKDEIWLDMEVKYLNWPYILMHEAYECRLMQQGMDYNAAHRRANGVERALRVRGLPEPANPIAVDMDGTLADDMDGGDELMSSEPRRKAREVLSQLRDLGAHVIIWTAHHDLNEVIAWLNRWQIPYDRITPKVKAAAYVDDLAVSAVDDWEDIARKLSFMILGKPKQPVESYDELIELAGKGQQEMEELLSSLDFEVIKLDDLALGGLEAKLAEPGGKIILAPAKAEKRAKEKVEADYGGDWSKLLDVVRAAVAVDSLPLLRGAVEAIKKAGASYARFPKDRFKEPLANGYRDYLVNYRLPCGMICEVQYHVKQMLIAREREKVAYDVVRAIKASMKEEGREEMTPAESEACRRAKKDSERLYARAWEECGGENDMPKKTQKGAVGDRYSFNAQSDIAVPENRLMDFERWADDIPEIGKGQTLMDTAPEYAMPELTSQLDGEEK